MTWKYSRTFEHHAGMERETVGVIPPDCIDIRLHHPDYVVAHAPSGTNS
jgi:hypothetical protein